MGYSAVFYVGAYVKLMSDLKVKQTTAKLVCPKCDKQRKGKFCEICGTEIIRVEEVKSKTLNKADDILHHIDYEENEFYCLPYGDKNIILPNYCSNFNNSYDASDDGKTIMLDQMIEERGSAVMELRRYGAVDLFRRLDNAGVAYAVGYGVTIGTT